MEENLKSFKDNYICDLGCGAGSALDYLLCEGNKIFTRGYGIDISPEVIALGKRILNERKTENCELVTGDIFYLDKSLIGRFDGVISLQTFNILPDYRGIAKAMCALSPLWIAFSTLGFEGMIDYNIKLYDYTKDKDGSYAEVFYNIYSLPLLKKYFEELGYSHFIYKEFEMDIDLPYTNKMGRGTYIIRTENGKRLQISGAMIMPWYFVFASK